MKKLILATRNAGKLREFQTLLQDMPVQIETLNNYPHLPDIAETGQSFLENAVIKATTVAKATGIPALADDSGLVVPALNGAPGVYSARYAGNEHDDWANNEKLLHEMQELEGNDRHAYFACCIVIARPDGSTWSCEGEVHGKITHQAQGDNGFGYDPLFFLPEKNATMAELAPDEKNEISHRGQAVQKAVQGIRQFLMSD